MYLVPGVDRVTKGQASLVTHDRMDQRRARTGLKESSKIMNNFLKRLFIPYRIVHSEYKRLVQGVDFVGLMQVCHIKLHHG